MRRLAALVIVLIAIAIPTAAVAAGPADDLGDGWTMTPTGPLGPADPDLRG
jgi:hypothetical protein